MQIQNSEMGWFGIVRGHWIAPFDIVTMYMEEEKELLSLLEAAVIRP